MQTQTLSTDSEHKQKSKWQKVSKRVPGLYLYEPSGVYHGRVKLRGRLYRESLRTTDLAFAKRKLRAMRERLERTDPRYGTITFLGWLEEIYAPTLRGSPVTLCEKQRVIATVKAHCTQARTQPIREIKESQLVTFLNEHYGEWSEAYWNRALSVLRDALALAVRDHVIVETGRFSPPSDVRRGCRDIRTATQR